MPFFAHPEWNTHTNVSGNNVDTEGENGYNDDTLNADEEYRAEEGGIYGEQGNSDSEVLGRRTVSTAGRNENSLRKSRENTSKLARKLGISTEPHAETRRIRAGSSGWFESNSTEQGRTSGGFGKSFTRNLSRITLKEVDSAGRKLSRELQNKLSNTAMKNEDGVILSFFHWTNSVFDIFEKGDIGFHFGTLQAAIVRQEGIQNKNGVGDSFFKEVYLNIKNPIKIDSDPMNWDTFVIAYKLNALGIISDSDVALLQTKEGFSGGKYGCEAVTELHNILKEKGYDGIIYENAFEGDFSVIAFSPDQVITVAENGVLKENSGVSEADSDESASFMPENSEEGDYESVLPDMSAAAPESDVFLDTAYADRGLERLTDEQKQIKAIGKALGREVEFRNLDRWRKDKNGNRKFFSPDGYYDKATGKIYINTSQKVKHNPLGFVFRHELTHFAETNKAAYDNFVAAVKKSKEFEAWLRRKTGVSDGSVDAMTAKLNEDVREQRSKYGIELGVAEGEKEVIADFVGDILFQKSGKTLDSLLNNVEAKQKPKIIQFVLDFVHWLREKFSGNKELTFELQRLESKYEALLKESQKTAEQKNNPQNKKSTETDGIGGEKYSITSDKQFEKTNIENGFKAVKELFEKAENHSNPEELVVRNAMYRTDIGDIDFVWGNSGVGDKFKRGYGISHIFNKRNFESGNGAETLEKVVEGIAKSTQVEIQHSSIDNNDRLKLFYNDTTIILSQSSTGNHWLLTGWINEKEAMSYANGEVRNSSEATAVAPTFTRHNGVDETASKLSISNSSENVNNKTELDNPYSMPSETDTDYTAEMDALDEQFKNGEIDRDQYISRINELYKKAGDEYGTIPEGEEVTGNENFDNPAPQSVEGKKKVRRHPLATLPLARFPARENILLRKTKSNTQKGVAFVWRSRRDLV